MLAGGFRVGLASESVEFGRIRVDGATHVSSHWGALFVLRTCSSCATPTDEELDSPAIESSLIVVYRAEPAAESITVHVSLFADTPVRSQVPPGVNQSVVVVHPFSGARFGEAVGPPNEELNTSITFDWDSERCEAVVPVNITMGANTWGSTLLWMNGVAVVATIHINVIVLAAEPTLALNPSQAVGPTTGATLVRRDSSGLNFAVRGCGNHPYLEWGTLALDGVPLEEAPYPSFAPFGPVAEPGTFITLRTQPGGESLVLPGTVGVSARAWAMNQGGCCRPSPSVTFALPAEVTTGRHRLTATFDPLEIVPSPLTTDRVSQLSLEREFVLFGPEIALSSERLSPGETFDVHGTGFWPTGRVSVFAKVRPFTGSEREIELGVADVDLDGEFFATFTLPDVASEFWTDLSSWAMTPPQPQLGILRVTIEDREFHDDFDDLDPEPSSCRTDVLPSDGAWGACPIRVGVIREIEFIKPE